MAGVRKLPDEKTLRQMRDQGMMLKDIAELYGVTTAGVWKALEEANLTRTRHTYHEYLPWKVERKHQALQIMEQFRRLIKRQNKEKLNDVEERRLNKWLTALKEDNVVVNYHPDAPPNAAGTTGGFYYVPRHPLDDPTSIIRTPEVQALIDAEQEVELKRAHG